MDNYPMWYEVMEDEPSTTELLQRDIKEMFADIEELLDEEEKADAIQDQEQKYGEEREGMDQ